MSWVEKNGKTSLSMSSFGLGRGGAMYAGCRTKGRGCGIGFALNRGTGGRVGIGLSVVVGTAEMSSCSSRASWDGLGSTSSKYAARKS